MENQEMWNKETRKQWLKQGAWYMQYTSTHTQYTYSVSPCLDTISGQLTAFSYDIDTKYK